MVSDNDRIEILWENFICITAPSNKGHLAWAFSCTETDHVTIQAGLERMNKYGSVCFYQNQSIFFFFFFFYECYYNYDRISHLRDGFRQVLA